MKKVLLVGSLLLGNGTTTRRIKQILEGMDDVELTVVTYLQEEIDAVSLPRVLAKYHALKIKRVLERKFQSLRKAPFDFVICITAQPVLALGSLWPQARVIMWFDSLPFHSGQGIQSLLLNAISKMMYRNAFTRVHTLLPASKQARAQIADFHFPKSAQVFLTYIGIDGSRWTPTVPREPRNTKEKTRILSVVTDPRRKGILEFFGYAIEHNLDLGSFEFSIVTTDTGAELHDLSDRLGIKVFRGINHENVADLIAMYHRAHVFFLPSKAEMIPHVLFEAIFAGVPVVASDVGAITEVIDEGVTGYVVKNRDWRGFYEALVKASSFPSYNNCRATRQFDLDTLKSIVANSLK